MLNKTEHLFYKDNAELFTKKFRYNIRSTCYQTHKPTRGIIIKITQNNIYFDLGSKLYIKARKKKFVQCFYKIYKTLLKTLHIKPNFIDFLKTIKLGNYFKFLTYKLVNGDYIGRIDYKRTTLHFIKQTRFYNFLYLRRNKKRVRGYILGTVKKGLSVTINGMIAFLPISQILKYRKKKKKYKKKKFFFLKGNIAYFKVSTLNVKRNNIVVKFDLFRPEVSKIKKNKTKIRLVNGQFFLLKNVVDTNIEL